MKSRLLLLAALAGNLFCQSQTIIADYPLTVNTADSTGNYGNISLNGLSGPSGSLCQSGNSNDYAITPSLTSFNLDSFQIQVDFSISQLTTKNNPIITAGPGYRWIGMYIDPSGHLGLLCNNGTNISSSALVTLTTWNTGQLQYTAGHVRLFLNDTLVLDQCIGALVTGGEQFFYTANFGTATAFNGCVKNLIISNNPVVPLLKSVNNVAICNGDSVMVGNHTYKTQGAYIDTILVTNGCASVLTTNLSINPVYHLTSSASVCSGGSYTFPDGSKQTDITSPVKYTSNLTTVQGCDSTILTTVSINPTYLIRDSVSLCKGSDYTFPDGSKQTDITSPVKYTSNLKTVQGCDSTILTTVSINPIYLIRDSVSLCKGSDYTFPDGKKQMNIISATSDTSNLQTVNSCDSIIITTINVITVDTSVTYVGNMLRSNASGSARYQWMDCNGKSILKNDTNALFSPRSNGEYAVIVSFMGCKDTSSCKVVVLTGIEQSANVGNNLSVYPNPASDHFTVRVNELPSTSTLSLVDIAGRSVYVKIIPAGKEYLETIDLTGYAKGMYALRLINADAVTTQRLVVN